MGQFSNKIGAFNKKVEKRYRAVARSATLETFELAQRVAKKGGTMRVDTGFLRASAQGKLRAMPMGETSNPGREKFPAGSQVSGEPVAVTILKWEPISNDKLFIGWTAAYARFREHQDGFLRTAVDKWDITVAKTAKRIASSGI